MDPIWLWKNVKCTFVQALRLCTGCTTHRESRSIALLFLDHCTRRGWGVCVTLRLLFIPGKTRYSLYRRLGGPQGRSGRAENLVHTGIRSLDRPAHSQSLYRLSYTAQYSGYCMKVGHGRDITIYIRCANELTNSPSLRHFVYREMTTCFGPKISSSSHQRYNNSK